MKKQPLLLGITGAFGSGKTTASSYFVKRGFTRITLSSFLEEALVMQGKLPITRRALQDVGNAWRKKCGAGILAQKALEYITEKKIEYAVIDGIRNVGEIEVLRAKAGFVLLSIIADRNVRFERIKNLKSREVMTKELFNTLDYRDLGVGEKDTGLQGGLCIALADVFIDNNDTMDVLQKKLVNFEKKYA